MPEFTLQIDGMHCGSCVRRASQALAAVEGALSTKSASAPPVSPPSAEPAPIDAAIAALAKAGYTAHRDSIVTPSATDRSPSRCSA